MKSTYEVVSRFVRWVVAALISLIVALPAYTAIGTSV